LVVCVSLGISFGSLYILPVGGDSMRRITSIAFLTGFFLSPSALATNVDSIHGQVSLNRGDGFRRLAGTTTARVGDQVMASSGGSARVVYPDACVVAVTPGIVITVRGESPCSCKEAADPKELSKQCPAGFLPKLAPVAIGVAIVGGAFAISTLNNEADKRPLIVGGSNLPASP
jgi:hypothetical protein